MLNRRQFLQRFVGSATALLVSQGCSSSHLTATANLPTDVLPSPTGTQARSDDKSPTVLRAGFSTLPKQMNPAFYSLLEEYQLGFAIFDGLVWVDETLTPQPLLATGWETSASQLNWTFTLEREVSFHHGTPLTAKDVVYTFTRLLDPKTGSAFRSVLSFIKQVEAVDDYTVCFRLSSPNVELPLLLGSPQASIVAHDYADAMMSTQPSGTGPFRFVEFVPGDRVRLVRNEAYWETTAHYIEQLEYVYGDYTTQAALLRAGKLDVVSQLGAEVIATLEDDPTINVVTVQSGGYQTIVMQATEAPFTDPRVRQALKCCADHSVLQQQVLLGRGLVGNNHPVTPISPFWNDLPKHAPDIAKAKALLQQAGYAKGLRLDLITSTSRPGMLELALAFREMVKPAGVEIQVVRVPADVYWSDYGGKTPFHIGNWGFRPSIDETFMIAYHSRAKGNESKWKNPELDQLLDQARTERDDAKRIALYQQAQALVWADGAVIVPYFKPVVIALRQNVQGFILHPAGWLDFSTVALTES